MSRSSCMRVMRSLPCRNSQRNRNGRGSDGRERSMSRQGTSGRRESSKSNQGRDLRRLEDIPNVGPAIAADLRRLGITLPAELPGCDPYAMYDDLCRITGQRHDPCLLDTFIAAVRFMEGEPKKPWWKYTAERKRELAARSRGSREQVPRCRASAKRAGTFEKSARQDRGSCSASCPSRTPLIRNIRRSLSCGAKAFDPRMRHCRTSRTTLRTRARD